MAYGTQEVLFFLDFALQTLAGRLDGGGAVCDAPFKVQVRLEQAAICVVGEPLLFGDALDHVVECACKPAQGVTALEIHGLELPLSDIVCGSCESANGREHAGNDQIDGGQHHCHSRQ